MRAGLGVLGIALGVGASAVGVFLLALGIARKNVELIRSGRRCVLEVWELAGTLEPGLLQAGLQPVAQFQGHQRIQSE